MGNYILFRVILVFPIPEAIEFYVNCQNSNVISIRHKGLTADLQCNHLLFVFTNLTFQKRKKFGQFMIHTL